jgi:hypothetical protein
LALGFIFTHRLVLPVRVYYPPSHFRICDSFGRMVRVLCSLLSLVAVSSACGVHAFVCHEVSVLVVFFMHCRLLASCYVKQAVFLLAGPPGPLRVRVARVLFVARVVGASFGVPCSWSKRVLSCQMFHRPVFSAAIFVAAHPSDCFVVFLPFFEIVDVASRYHAFGSGEEYVGIVPGLPTDFLSTVAVWLAVVSCALVP